MARRRATTWGQPCQSNHWAGMQRVGVVAGRNTKRATWMPTRRRVLTAVGRSNLAHGNIGKFSERFCRRPTRLRLALNAVDVDGRATPWTARPMPPRDTLSSDLLPDGRGPMPDLQVPLNCPVCGTALVYVQSDGDTHFYRCPHHGSIILPPDGRVRPAYNERVN